MNLHVKIVVIGNGAVGKTCVLMTWKDRVFPDNYIPTVCDGTSEELEYIGHSVTTAATQK